MDGSSGPSQVRFRMLFALLLATFQVAFAVSGAAADARKKGFAALDKGDCRGAVAELLVARGAGDSSNTLMLRLCQALECDNRLVDALSGTYADNKADTAGRVDLLLFRAQLLRKVGLGDEADKVEKEIGTEIVAGIQGRKDEPENVWAWSVSYGGMSGWIYQDDKLRSADSLGIYQSWMHTNNNPSVRQVTRNSAIVDSITISGAQIPVSAWITLDALAGNWNVSVSAPIQVTMATNLKDWLGANAEIDLSGSYQWKPWLGMDISGSLGRYLSPVVGSDPFHQDALGTAAVLRANVGKLSMSAASGASWTFFQNGATSRRFSEGLQAGVSLPRKVRLDLGGGFSWYRDESESSGYQVPVWIASVRNAYPHQLIRDVEVLDPSGNPYGGLLINRVIAGTVPSAGIATEGYNIPYGSPQDWNRWNASVSVSHDPWPRFGWTGGFDVVRTELLAPQEGTLVDPFDAWNANLDAVRIFRDVATGVDYVAYEDLSNPAHVSNLVPLKWARRRVDIATSWRLGLKYKLSPHVSMRAGWSFTGSESNLMHIMDFASYTRTVWNMSASVGW